MRFRITDKSLKKIAQSLEEALEPLTPLENNLEETLEEPDISSVEALQYYLTEKYDVQLYLGETTGGMIIHKIVVPEEERESGIGTQIMTEIVQYADDNGLAIGLTPDTTYGGHQGRLEQFYRGFGFIPNKGRNKDYMFMESWIRPV